MTGITTAKQANLISDEKVRGWKVKVYGLGSIGSILVKQLALVGFKDITGYDFDTVDDDNIGSQEFRVGHVGLKKTEAIQKLMKEDYGFDMRVVEGKIDANTPVMPEDKTIYFCAFDSLEARKILWDKLKTFPVIWGESRIGMTSQRYYFVDLKNRNEEWIAEYDASLDPSGPRTELKCGEKGCYPSNAELVGKLVRQFVNIAEEKDVTTLYVGDWGTFNGINRTPEREVPAMNQMSYNQE